MTLAGKRLLVTGVSTPRSIAFAIAREALLAGADVVLSSFGRMRSLTERSAERLPRPVDVIELDVNEPGDLDALPRDLSQRWGELDGAVHAVAYAPPDALSGDFLGTPTESAALAFQTSAVSLKTLAAALAPLLSRSDGSTTSLVSLSFESSVAWPSYDWMGVSKAALEAVSRYLARDLGPRGIRVNVVSAGPLRTLAAGEIPAFAAIDRAYRARAPIGWDNSDPTPVAQAACFLLSDWSRGIAGEVVRVDGGCHSIGCAAEGATAGAA